MPTCIAITNRDIVDDDRPMPPRSGGKFRYAGTQLLRPHQPNNVHAFISVMNAVLLATPGANSALIRPRSAEDDSRQIFGSSTRWRIQIVNSAGRTPTKNTPRQPQIGMTIRLTSAARP